MKLEQAHAALYPTVSAFGSYTSFSSPTNLRPMAPTEVNIAAGDIDHRYRYGYPEEGD